MKLQQIGDDDGDDPLPWQSDPNLRLQNMNENHRAATGHWTQHSYSNRVTTFNLYFCWEGWSTCVAVDAAHPQIVTHRPINLRSLPLWRRIYPTIGRHMQMVPSFSEHPCVFLPMSPVCGFAARAHQIQCADDKLEPKEREGASEKEWVLSVLGASMKRDTTNIWPMCLNQINLCHRSLWQPLDGGPAAPNHGKVEAEDAVPKKTGSSYTKI